MQYEYISLPDSSRWGLLMPSDCALSQKRCVERQELLSVPLILHRRAGLQRLITRWANAELQSLHIAATYNVVNGSPERIARSGLGYFLTTEATLPSTLDERLCFRPLEPPLEIHYALLWKRYAALTTAAEVFLQACRDVCQPQRP